LSAQETSLFERTVGVRALSPGRYEAHVDPAWSGPAAPNGGVLAAAMLRAAEAELGAPAPPPRTIAAQYLDAPAPGGVGLGVAILRRGKRVAAADVRMFQAERLMCQATIMFSAPRPQATDLRFDPPSAPRPDEVAPLAFDAAPQAPPVFHQLEVRPTFGGWMFAGACEAVTGGWLALRDDDAPIDPARLVAFTDLWWPAVFGVLRAPAAVPTIQLTVHLRAVATPVAPPVLARVQTRTIAEGHLEETVELWSTDGVLLAESRQLALLRV
jgi:acyl-CoA thioesterase